MLYKGIDLSSLTDEEVLFFTRIHGKKGIFGNYYPSNFLNEFNNLKKFRTISEYPVGDVYINIDLKELKNITNEDFSLFENVLDIEDIIVRCRALRNIPYEESRQLIWVVAKFFVEYFKSNPSLKVMVALIVDNYVMDVMERLSIHYKVEMIQLVGFFVPGYSRFTNRFGIGVPVRSVSEDEVNKVYERFVNKGRSHLAISKNKAIKNAIKDYLSYKYRYFFRYLIAYKLQGNLAYEYRFSKYFKGFHSLKKIMISKFFDDFSAINDKPNELIFIPLHFHPEATVDYWADVKEHADYINSLLKIIASCKAKGLKVIFKEHPNYYLRRSPDFYKKIKNFKNTYLISPYITSHDVYDKTDNVCVHTGSAGVEAIMLDKKVYTVSENYYSFNRLPNLKEYHKTDYPFYSVEEKKNLIRRVLETSIRKDS